MRNEDKRIINIQSSKSLRLDNVLIKDIITMTAAEIEDGSEDEDFSLELEVEKMNNEIKTKGANQIGPLIQYSGATGDEDTFEISSIIRNRIENDSMQARARDLVGLHYEQLCFYPDLTDETAKKEFLIGI